MRRQYLFFTVGFLIVVAALTASAPVRAQSSEAKTRARANLVSGVELLNKGDAAGALTHFQDAYKLVPSPKIFYNLGLAYSALGRKSEAVEAFQKFLADAPEAPADARQNAEAETRRLQDELRATAPAPIAPLPMQPQKPAPATAAPIPPTTAETPPALAVTAAPAGGARMNGKRIAGISLAAVGVVAIGVGAIFAVKMKSKQDSIETELKGQQMIDGARLNADYNTGKSYQTAQFVGYAVGAAAIAGGVALYLLGNRPVASGALDQPSGVTVTPVLGRQSAGAALGATF